MSRITALNVENFKRIKAARIKPDGSPMIVIGGRNSQGKTSLLDAIQALFGGGRRSPEQPIRQGQSSAKITADVSDVNLRDKDGTVTALGNLRVTTTWDAKKGRALVITSSDGYEAPTPQKILDELFNGLTFDPLAFTRDKPENQLAILRGLVGLDVSDLEDEHGRAYVTRTSVNRKVKELEAKLKGHPEPENVPPALSSVTEVARELEAARATNRANAQARNELNNAQVGINNRKAELDRIQKQIESLTRQAATLAEAIDADTVAYQQRSAAVSQLVDVATGEIEAKLETVEADNERYRAEQARVAVATELQAARDESERLTQRLDELDRIKSERVQAAKFPVPGLGFSSNGVTYQGVPFEQASTSDRIRISAAMGFELNPELRVMLVREGAFLDNDGLAILEDIAAKYEGQIWLERVGEGEEVGIIIEDGEIKETRQRKSKATAKSTAALDKLLEEVDALPDDPDEIDPSDPSPEEQEAAGTE